jgi:signal transduction histidine kinase
MTGMLETPIEKGTDLHLQQLIKWLADDYLSNNDHISHELYENIAQSLVAIRTQLVLLEEDIPSELSELIGNIHQLYTILHAVLGQILSLADGLHSNILANKGLVAAIKLLCQSYPSQWNIQVSFGGNLQKNLPEWVSRQHTICLYYFIEQALGIAGATGNPIFVYLECEQHEITAIVRFITFDHPANLDQENILKILREWLSVWGGHMECSIPSPDMVQLTASLEANAIESGA